MDKFKTGDAVKVTDADGRVFKGEVRTADHIGYAIWVPGGHRTVSSKAVWRGPYVWAFTAEELAQEPFGDYGLRIEPWAEEPAFTLLDDEGRKALKKGDRVLVEVKVLNPEPDDGGDIRFLSSGTAGSCTCHAWAKPKDVFALLPPAKKLAAVGDFVRILGRTGSKGKVLAFASNGHAVVEYAAGDGINVAAYDLSCLEVIS